MPDDAITPDHFTIVVDGNETDFVDAWLLSNRPARMKQYSVLVLAGLILIASRFFLHDDITVLFAILGGWFVVLVFLLPLMARNAIRKYYRKHPLYDETKTFTLTPDGLACDSYSHQSFVRWHAFSHWRETPRLFLMYFGASASQYIPKRCLAGEQQIAELRGILQKTIGRTKYAAPVKAFPVDAPHARQSEIMRGETNQMDETPGVFTGG